MVVQLDLMLSYGLMLKKTYFFNKQIALKFNKKILYIYNLILTSFLLNHQLLPINRLSFLGKSNIVDNHFYRYSTHCKLVCPISLSYKVPNKNYQYSRFFFNKQMNKLVLSWVVK